MKKLIDRIKERIEKKILEEDGKREIRTFCPTPELRRRQDAFIWGLRKAYKIIEEEEKNTYPTC